MFPLQLILIHLVPAGGQSGRELPCQVVALGQLWQRLDVFDGEGGFKQRLDIGLICGQQNSDNHENITFNKNHSNTQNTPREQDTHQKRNLYYLEHTNTAKY